MSCSSFESASVSSSESSYFAAAAFKIPRKILRECLCIFKDRVLELRLSTSMSRRFQKQKYFCDGFKTKRGFSN